MKLRILLKLFLFHSLLLRSAWALPEGELPSKLSTTVFPFFESLHQGTLTNSQGMTLCYSHSDPEAFEKFLVILPGRTEPSKKYAETIFDLHHKGIGVFILDHQGQGCSGRLLPDSHKRHVVKFEDFVTDLSQWMDTVVLPKTKGKRLYLLGHSMGALIGTYYLNQRPMIFRKAVLSTPLYELNTGPYPEWLAKTILRSFKLLGRGEDYILGKGPYSPAADILRSYQVTHSPARFEISKEIYRRWKENVMGGPTVNWTLEITHKSQAVPALAKNITSPVLLLQAGEDIYVKPDRQNEFCELAPNCRLSKFPGAYHEVLNESDTIRDKAMAELLEFIAD